MNKTTRRIASIVASAAIAASMNVSTFVSAAPSTAPALSSSVGAGHAGKEYPTNAVIDFDFGTYDVKAGDEVKVKVKVDSHNNPIIAMDVVFKSDFTVSKISGLSDALEDAPIVDNPELPGLNLSSKNSEGDGIVPDTDAAVFILTLDVPSTTPTGEYYIDFASKCEVYYDNSAWTYKTSSKKGVIKVTNDDPNAGFVLGDVNFDGAVDGSDATMVLKEFSRGSNGTFTALEKKAGDVDGDGSIDGSDATIILKFFGGRDKIAPGTKLEDWLATWFNKE